MACSFKKGKNYMRSNYEVLMLSLLMLSLHLRLKNLFTVEENRT